jgi:hypothetical protein
VSGESRLPPADATAAPALLDDLLRALCEESRALARGDLARLAETESWKRHLLRLLTLHGQESRGAGG